MKFLTRILAPLALVTTLAAPAAQAATIDFVIDLDGSDVMLTETGGGGVACFVSNCGVEATLALNDGATYTIGTGDEETFDFITFTGNGTTGVTPRRFDITAILAFSSPDLDITGTGTGAAFLFSGNITAGVLNWISITPSGVTFPNGSKVAFDFEEGSGLFLGNSETTTASISGISIVPLPAGGLLLLGALGGLALLRRRKTV